MGTIEYMELAASVFLTSSIPQTHRHTHTHSLTHISEQKSAGCLEIHKDRGLVTMFTPSQERPLWDNHEASPPDPSGSGGGCTRRLPCKWTAAIPDHAPGSLPGRLHTVSECASAGNIYRQDPNTKRFKRTRLYFSYSFQAQSKLYKLNQKKVFHRFWPFPRNFAYCVTVLK